jgi:hypothetical protein
MNMTEKYAEVVGFQRLTETLTQLEELRKEAINFGTVSLVSAELMTGDFLQVEVENPGIPRIDCVKLSYTVQSLDLTEYPVSAVFRTVSGFKEVKCDAEVSSENLWQFRIPEDALSGFVTILVQVFERGNPLNPVSGHEAEGDLCVAGPGYSCCSDELNTEKLLRSSESEKMHPVKYPLSSLFSNIGCTCTVKCPKFAIVSDSNGCHVDEDRCDGHRYLRKYDSSSGSAAPVYRYIKGNRVYQRKTYSDCLKCFAPPTSCVRGILRGSLYIKENGCCGSCPTQSKHDGKNNLKELCRFDAINGGTPPDDLPYLYQHGYRVNKEACIGCRYCYDNITCHNNIYSPSIWFGAYIPKTKQAQIVVHSLKQKIRVLETGDFDFLRTAWMLSLYGIFQVQNDYTLVVAGNKVNVLPFHFDQSSSHTFTEKFFFSGEVHFDLYIEDYANKRFMLWSGRKNSSSTVIKAVPVSNAVAELKCAGEVYELKYSVKML